MKMDFGKKKGFATKQSNRVARTKWLWMACIFIIAILVSGIGIFAYQKQNAVMISTTVSSFYSRINHWLTERKTRIHENIVKVKQLTVNKKDANQEIHFEFYTALQNMQVTVPDTTSRLADTRSVAVVNAHAPAANEAMTNFVSKDDMSSTKVLADKKSVSSETLFDAEQLQHALKDEFSQLDMQTSGRRNRVASQEQSQVQPIQYILQLGVFKNVAGAERFRASFARSGFVAKVVKTTIAGRMAYNVQLGPFINKSEAMLAQRQTREKVNGIIRKVRVSSP